MPFSHSPNNHQNLIENISRPCPPIFNRIPNTKINTVNPHKSVSVFALDELIACATRATGLLHLLAAAAAKSECMPFTPPNTEEQEGIMWLSMDTGTALKAAVTAVLESPTEVSQPALETAR